MTELIDKTFFTPHSNIILSIDFIAKKVFLLTIYTYLLTFPLFFISYIAPTLLMYLKYKHCYGEIINILHKSFEKYEIFHIKYWSST